MPLISIIMPVYNVEDYLEVAINSVRKQSFKDWELILVDDSSTDKSLQICKCYAEKEQRIRLIHKEENEGLSKARNTGLKESDGKWVLFMDSDDRISANTIEELLGQTISNEIDLIVFGMIQEYEDLEGNIKRRRVLLPEEGLFSGNEKIGNLLMALDFKGLFPYAWNKLYRREFLSLNNLQFESIKMIEDFLFNSQVFLYADSVLCVGKSYYHYRKPAHKTLASEYLEDFHVLCLKRMQREKEILIKRNCDTENNMQLLYYVHIKHIFSSFVRVVNNQIKNRDKINKIKEILNDERIQKSLPDCIIKDKKINIVYRIIKSKNYLFCFCAAKAYALLGELHGKIN